MSRLINGLLLLFAFCLLSCSTTKNITGKYVTNFAILNFFGTTITLKEDMTLDYRFSGDLIFHRVTGTYKVYDRKVYMLFDKEILDTNFAKTPLFDNEIKTLISEKDTVSYQKMFYIKHDKLFFSYLLTGKRITKAKRYNKRNKYLLFGSHYYKRRWYLRQVAA